MMQTSVPLFAKYVLHSSDLTVSLIATVATITTLLSLFFFGFRRVAIGRAIFLSLILSCVTLPMFLVAFNAVALALITALVTFWLGALLSLLLASLTIITSPQNRQRDLTIFSAVLSLSLVLGPIFQGAVLTLTGDNLVLSMLSFAALMASAAVLFSRIRLDENLKVGGTFEVGFVKDTRYWIGVLATESFTVPFLAILTFGGILARNNFGASYADIETLLAAFFVTSFLVRVALVKFTVSRLGVMMLSFVMSIVGLMVVAFSSSLIQLAVGFVLLAYSHGATFPVGQNYIADSVIEEKLVPAYTVSALIDACIYLVGTPLVGIAAQYLGLNSAFLLIEFPVAAIGASYLLLLREASRTTARSCAVSGSVPLRVQHHHAKSKEYLKGLLSNLIHGSGST
jgi:predicted MFS family arabinose efflux permease